MGQARLGSYEFRIDPKSVKWKYQVRTNVTETVGGKVIQVFGTSIQAMSIEGSVGTGGKDEFRALVMQLVSMARQQAGGSSPVRFSYPPKGWEFDVYIQSISDNRGATFTESYEKFHYSFTLVLIVANENIGLKQIAENAYIDRLARGIGWIPSEYQGPDGVVEATQIAQDEGWITQDEDEDAPPSGDGGGDGD